VGSQGNLSSQKGGGIQNNKEERSIGDKRLNRIRGGKNLCRGSFTGKRKADSKVFTEKSFFGGGGKGGHPPTKKGLPSEGREEQNGGCPVLVLVEIGNAAKKEKIIQGKKKVFPWTRGGVSQVEES